MKTKKKKTSEKLTPEQKEIKKIRKELKKLFVQFERIDSIFNFSKKALERPFNK